MLRKLFFCILTAIAALWIADRFLPGVEFQGPIETFLLCGSILGLVNSLIKPILKKFAFPLRLLTLGLFNLVIDMAILWFVDILFPELEILGLIPLFLASLIISVLGFLNPID